MCSAAKTLEFQFLNQHSPLVIQKLNRLKTNNMHL